MPLLFIVLGVAFIFSLFNMLKIFKPTYNLFLQIVLVLILIGFFGGNIFINNISFNFFVATSCLVLLVLFFVSKLLSLADFVIVFVVGVAYYKLLSFNLSFMLGYNYDYLIKIFLIFVSVINFKSKSKLSFCFLLANVMSIISAFAGYDNYGVMYIDFMISIEILVALLVVLQILRFFKDKEKICCEKKINCLFNFVSSGNLFLFKK